MFLWIFIIEIKWNFVQSILGGRELNITDAPYQVNYVDKCGAVLIHKNWALTTAHCGTDGTYIRIGSKYRLKSRKIRVEFHIIHPQYQRRHEFDYDVQLLKLPRALHFSKWVKAISICDEGCDGMLQVFGWGYSKEKGDMHDTLRGIEIEMVPLQECQDVKEFWYNNTLTSRMFCAGGAGKDACQGDSGGAAVSSGQLVGLSSFGFGCGRNLPGVYTKLSHKLIRSWIENHSGV